MATETLCAQFTRTDFPFTQNGYRYEKLGGPFTSSGDADCLSCTGCNGGSGAPIVLLTMSWTAPDEECRDFFGDYRSNGEQFPLCYAQKWVKRKRKHGATNVITYNITVTWALTSARSGSNFILTASYGARKYPNEPSRDFGYFRDKIKLQMPWGSAYSAYADQRHINTKQGNTTFARTTCDLDVHCSGPFCTYHNYGIPDSFFGTATIPDKEYSGHTITISWSRGPGDWESPTA